MSHKVRIYPTQKRTHPLYCAWCSCGDSSDLTSLSSAESWAAKHMIGKNGAVIKDGQTVMSFGSK